jgi:hypothetical protein
MTNLIDRVNRLVLIILGAIFLGAGVGGLLVAAGVFGQTAAHTSLVTDGMRDYAHANDSWYWGAWAGGAFLLAALGLWWLAAQSGSSRVSSLQLEIDRSRGATRLQTSALTDALEDDVATYSGVNDATARILGSAHEPLLRLDVALDESADIGSIRERLETQAIPRVRQAASVLDLPVWLRLEIASAAATRSTAGNRPHREVL